MSGMTYLIQFFIMVLLFVAPSSVRAILADRNQISRIPVQEKTEVHIFKDLRSRVKYKAAFRIQTEDGMTPKYKILSFDKNEMRLKVFKAWVNNGGKETEVPATMIQFIPVSEEAGFSNYVSVEVAFPKMMVGSTIRYEYEVEETQPPVLGFFSYVSRLDSEYHAASGYEFKVTSEVPVYFWQNDPEQVFQLQQTGKTLQARLKRNITHRVINESYGVLSQNRYPTVFVSTAKDWNQVGDALKKAYEKRLSENMTPLMKNILTQVKKQKGFFAQVKETNRLVGNQIRYMGDWRGRHSNQVPRSIQEISDSQFGDCKDYALVATKLLRALGYEANFASVYSDRIPVPDSYYQHPNNYFNHQIVHVKLGKAEYWIDPTSQDETQLVDDSLVNRKALVWGKKLQMRRIPAYTESDNGFRYQLVVNPTNKQRFLGDLEIESWGLESKFARQEGVAENPMLRWMTVFFPDIKATSQEFRSHTPRSKKPWAHRARGLGTFEDVFDKTPMGEGLRLGYSGFLRAMLDVDDTWTSDFDFGFPSDRSYQVEFKKRQFLLSGGESCAIESKWMDIDVEVENGEKSAFLRYHERFHTSEISNKELKTKAFRNLQSQVKSCLAGRVLILQDPATALKPQRGLASEGVSIQLKRVGPPPKGMAKYVPKKLTPIRDPLPKRVSRVKESGTAPSETKIVLKPATAAKKATATSASGKTQLPKTASGNPAKVVKPAKTAASETKSKAPRRPTSSDD